VYEYPLLEHIATFGKPILSTGISCVKVLQLLFGIHNTVAALRTVLINIHLVQLQCYDGNA
jgi:sialic acid synthase SpsE